MDFFGHQEQARRASGRLVWLFIAAVLTIIALIYTAVKLLLVKTRTYHANNEVLDWPVLGAVAGVVTLVVVGAMLFKTAQLRSGGGAVASMLGGRRVDPGTKDPQERMLHNVVEEMAIASGVPVPEVYVLDNEAAINAFAAGWTTSDAAVAVTRGSLDAFSRDELQGVIAHEFSHVFHGDMRLNIRLMGVLFGILCIAVVGRIVAHSGGHSRSSNRNNGGVALFGVALIVIGYAGVFFARLIQAAVSRQREYLADASAVQYTRNPRGIGMALAKIGGLGAKLKSAHAEEASHMMFAEAVSHMGGGLATHPPLEKRIERVLPGFLKKLQQNDDMTQAVADTPLPAGMADGMAAGVAAGFAGAAGAAANPEAKSAASPTRTRGPAPADLVDSVGDPQPHHVEAARALLAQLPLELSMAVHDPERAASVVYALLLDDDAEVLAHQLEMLADATDPGVQLITRDHHRQIREFGRELRLPLIELAIPSLRRLPVAQRAAVRRHARALALADDHLSPFEFALLQSLERHVRDSDEPDRRAGGRPEALAQHREHAATVLSVIAHAGAPDDVERARAAFARGAGVLGIGDVLMLPPERATAQHLEEPIGALRRVSPLGKRNLVTACAQVAADDGYLDPDEVDLVRALAELWDCPVPLQRATA